MDRGVWSVRQIQTVDCVCATKGIRVNDKTILDQISSLVDEEHELLQLGGEEGGLDDEQKARLQEVKVHLDQCWDLLRQRRAKREFGQDPDDAEVRDEKTVEGYRA